MSCMFSFTFASLGGRQSSWPNQRKYRALTTSHSRKVDWRLIPILGLLYSVAGLDRVNLSNARVAGMNQDLRFDIGDRYTIALLVFFITYFLFEIPTVLSMRWIGPKWLLNSLAIAWGTQPSVFSFVCPCILSSLRCIMLFSQGACPQQRFPAVETPRHCQGTV